MAIAIAINDRVADGRDMSWLWDIDFTSLKNQNVQHVSGTRAVDMALRLQYDDIPVEMLDTDLEKALVVLSRLPEDKVIFASYTAMLGLHTMLTREAGKRL